MPAIVTLFRSLDRHPELLKDLAPLAQLLSHSHRLTPSSTAAHPNAPAAGR